MGFPTKKQLNKVLPVLKKAQGSLALKDNPSALERFRWDICQQFILFKRRHGYTQKQIAELIGIDEPKISKILHHRIEEFSTDRLISLYEKINPKAQLKVG